jgi:hypothetical protein
LSTSVLDRNAEFSCAVGHVEKLLDRRISVTSFYLSVNAAIATVIGLLVKDAQVQQELLPATIFLLIVAGLGACWIWRSLIKQYERLLDWWYARLREMESGLPDSTQLVTREYQDLYALPKSGKSATRIGMTQRELALNGIFIGLYLVFGAGIILSLLF